MIYQSFLKGATNTWSTLSLSYFYNFSTSEETITDNNLLQLQVENLHGIRTYKNSKLKEGRETGADWEWWILSSKGVLGLRIQAKKIDSKRLLYPELNKQGKKGALIQANKLIKDARQKHMIPLYVFYNFWDLAVLPLDWKCHCEDLDITLWGCSIASADNVKAKMIGKGSTLEDMLEISHPWSCLFCCPVTKRQSLSDRVFDAIMKNYMGRNKNI
jgi:hypothetical protein